MGASESCIGSGVGCVLQFTRAESGCILKGEGAKLRNVSLGNLDALVPVSVLSCFL